MHTTITMNERTLPFQGLRVLMIMGVMCLHTYQYPVFGAGEELVSFFFVLSGFLYKDKLSWKSFMLHKFKQIFPFYWICLGIVLFISFIRGGTNLEEYWSNLSFVFSSVMDSQKGSFFCVRVCRSCMVLVVSLVLLFTYSFSL